MSHKIEIEVNKIENTCFVVMPFSSLYQVEYESIIKPILHEVNISCVRGDEIYSKQRIMDDIWESIKSCRFVIAELTGKNPNVLYEVGLAHALGKPVIILTRNSDDVPFDLKALRYLFYDINDPFWGENLKKGLKNLIEKIIENPEIDKYLSGINPIQSTAFPIIIENTFPKEEEIVLFDIAGNWKAKWEPESEILHTITINITQNGNLLSGVGTINHYVTGYDDLGKETDPALTVVQQIFEGKIVKNKITLNGVNYTYIERGNSPNYALDNFELELRKGKLIGIAYEDDEYDLGKNIIFTKL